MKFEAGAMSNSSGKNGVYGRKKVYDREQPFTSWLGCRKEKKALGHSSVVQASQGNWVWWSRLAIPALTSLKSISAT